MPNVIFQNFFLAERYFAECLVNQTLFSRIIVQQNVILPNRYWAERHFPETLFSQSSFSRKDFAERVFR